MKRIRTLLNNRNIKACICLMGVFVITSVLFYRFMFDYYNNDYYAHIEHSLAGTTYSINIILMPLFYKITNSNLGIVFMMSLLILASVLTMSLFLRFLYRTHEDQTDFISLIPFACSLLFICKLCIPEWSGDYNISAFSTQPWHNSTYIEMRCLAMLTLLFYFKIRKDYLQKIDWKDCLWFTLSLMITNFSKPSFLLAFSPVMLIVLVYDFIRTEGKSFKNAFFFGLCVLISCAVVLVQYLILFPSEGESQLVISAEHAVSYFVVDRKFLLYLVLNYLFPIYTSYLFIKNRKRIEIKDKKLYMEIWMMGTMSLLISMFLTEVGERAKHGNFTWGNPFFAYVLFAVSMFYLTNMRKKGIIGEDKFLLGKAIYAAHVVMGLFYFALLVMGYNPYGI